MGIKDRKFLHDITEVLHALGLKIPHLRLHFDCLRNSSIILDDQNTIHTLTYQIETAVILL